MCEETFTTKRKHWAYRFTIDNIGGTIDFLARKGAVYITFTPVDQTLRFPTPDGGVAYVRDGEWIVISEDGKVVVLDDATYKTLHGEE